MKHKREKIYLAEDREVRPDRPYEVVRLVNCTDFYIGEPLPQDKVDELIARGSTVTITGPKA